MQNVLPGLKTHLVVIGGILTIVGMYFHGDMNLADAITKGLQFLGLSALRVGVASIAPGTKP
jgi:hypothetical protein